MLRKVSFKGKLLTILIMLLIFTVVMSGCGKEAVDSAPSGENTGQLETTKPAPTKTKVTLYFSDQQSMYLIPEEREVLKADEGLEEVVIRELIKGPQKENLVKTIPEGTELLSTSVIDNVVYVSFSNEFKSRHWGGTAGENMTIYSVVNSLCKLPGIEKVQFLLEGEKVESILGHLDTSVPITPNWEIVSD
ncbi:MAG: hypothetical protein PWP31_1111 [Clostridia bacterium]|nr:hypothetical protein [Clostridia bacterium]